MNFGSSVGDARLDVPAERETRRLEATAAGAEHRSLDVRLIRSLHLAGVGRALAVLVAIVAALGTIEHVWASAPLAAFGFGRSVSLATLLTGLMLLAAAGTGMVLRRLGDAAIWGPLALLLGALGLAIVAGVQDRLLGVEAGFILVWAPALAAISAALAAIVWLLRSERAAAATVATGGLAWLAGQLLELAPEGSAGKVIGTQVLELSGAALVVFGMLVFGRRMLEGEAPRERPLALARSAALRVSVPWLAAIIGAGIALFTLLGTVGLVGPDPYIINLIGEQNLPSSYASALLAAPAALAWVLGAIDEPRARGWWRALAVVLAFLAVDEYMAIHEQVKGAIDVSPDQIVLAPIVVAAGVTWLVALMRFASLRPVVVLWVGGALAWVLSQAIDATQPADRLVWSVVPEEALEMIGSTLFLFALLLVLRSWSRRSPAPSTAAT